MKKEHLWLVAAVLVGVMAAPSIRKLPVLSKLPSF